MTKREKQELTPTLKVEDGFKGMAKAEIISVRNIDTKHGEKVLMTISDSDGKPHNVFLNVASMNNLIDAFGDEDDSWIGKMVTLTLETDEHYNKEKIVVQALED